jgi:hypothetical protein
LSCKEKAWEGERESQLNIHQEKREEQKLRMKTWRETEFSLFESFISSVTEIFLSVSPINKLREYDPKIIVVKEYMGFQWWS